MLFAQYYLDCLSQASYLIGDETTKRAVVVDPRRDVSEYLADAAAHGLTIELIINTHFHADFLAGHLELAEATGAPIAYGARAEAEYPIRALHDGERISLGEVALDVLETPGHTPESVSIVVFGRGDDAVPYGVLTGDTMFIGDVGRPDLLASVGFTADELGRMLYHSVHDKLLALPDTTGVFPAHGAGSACGKNLSTERQSTIGQQRRSNYACQPMTEDEFIALVTADQPSAPGYFIFDALLNRRLHLVHDVHQQPPALSYDEVIAARGAGAVLVDGRDPAEFAAAHLRGSVSVGADGRFAETAGSVISPESDLVILAPQDREEEMALRLARIGFDRVLGYLREPERHMAAHPDEVDQASRLTVPQLRWLLETGEPPVLLDVRNPGERHGGAFIAGALPIPLAQLPQRLGEVPVGRPLVVYCAGGYRSMVASSLLRRHGWGDVSDLVGGYNAWTAMLQAV